MKSVEFKIDVVGAADNSPHQERTLLTPAPSSSSSPHPLFTPEPVPGTSKDLQAYRRTPKHSRARLNFSIEVPSPSQVGAWMLSLGMRAVQWYSFHRLCFFMISQGGSFRVGGPAHRAERTSGAVMVSSGWETKQLSFTQSTGLCSSPTASLSEVLSNFTPSSSCLWACAVHSNCRNGGSSDSKPARQSGNCSGTTKLLTGKDASGWGLSFMNIDWWLPFTAQRNPETSYTSEINHNRRSVTPVESQDSTEECAHFRTIYSIILDYMLNLLMTHIRRLTESQLHSD